MLDTSVIQSVLMYLLKSQNQDLQVNIDTSLVSFSVMQNF